MKSVLASAPISYPLHMGSAFLPFPSDPTVAGWLPRMRGGKPGWACGCSRMRQSIGMQGRWPGRAGRRPHLVCGCPFHNTATPEGSTEHPSISFFLITPTGAPPFHQEGMTGRFRGGNVAEQVRLFLPLVSDKLGIKAHPPHLTCQAKGNPSRPNKQA